MKKCKIKGGASVGNSTFMLVKNTTRYSAGIIQEIESNTKKVYLLYKKIAFVIKY